MEWVETTGSTLEAAKEAALDELGVDEHDAEFEVLQEPKTGLFGRVRAEARIRARVRPTAPRAKEDRRDRRRSRSREAAASRTVEGDDSGSGADAGSPRPRRRRSGGSGAGAQEGGSGNDGAQTPGGGSRGGVGTVNRDEQGPEGDGSSAGATDGTEDGPNGPGGSRARRSRGRSGRNGGQAAAAGTDSGEARSSRPPRPTQSKSNDRAGEGPTVDVPLEEQGRIAEEFLRGLVAQFGRQAEISIKQPDEDNLEVAVTGDDLGLLIGPKGATLLAIQDLTRTVVQRKTSAGNGRIHVDVGGYREKRATALANFARQVAAQVVATGARRALEPMTAADRKIVHDALNEVEGVQTLSEGEEPQRRVVITPAG